MNLAVRDIRYKLGRFILTCLGLSLLLALLLNFLPTSNWYGIPDWVALVLAFWSVLAGGASIVIIPVTLLLMLAVVPAAASFPPAHWSEWMAAVVGIGLGGLAAGPARRTIEGSEGTA